MAFAGPVPLLLQKLPETPQSATQPEPPRVPNETERPVGSRDGSSRSFRRLHPVREPVPTLPSRFRGRCGASAAIFGSCVPHGGSTRAGMVARVARGSPCEEQGVKPKSTDLVSNRDQNSVHQRREDLTQTKRTFSSWCFPIGNLLGFLSFPLIYSQLSFSISSNLFRIPTEKELRGHCPSLPVPPWLGIFEAQAHRERYCPPEIARGPRRAAGEVGTTESPRTCASWAPSKLNKCPLKLLCRSQGRGGWLLTRWRSFKKHREDLALPLRLEDRPDQADFDEWAKEKVQGRPKPDPEIKALKCLTVLSLVIRINLACIRRLLCQNSETKKEKDWADQSSDSTSSASFSMAVSPTTCFGPNAEISILETNQYLCSELEKCKQNFRDLTEKFLTSKATGYSLANHLQKYKCEECKDLIKSVLEEELQFQERELAELPRPAARLR
ncbi:PREDICTED: uncharacterized protein LOC105549806 [Mandrillus leucophaeus]|uniref:uncharacterized protein LOC105549806 n=1 Tax=Mandrillus leucophaeus TaxID=9568 RepID=UPI0005F3CA0A|nr:PREDICTED: uncharacterized protein LOC105549806 [Mandrillus leucophaeus]